MYCIVHGSGSGSGRWADGTCSKRATAALRRVCRAIGWQWQWQWQAIVNHCHANCFTTSDTANLHCRGCLEGATRGGHGARPISAICTRTGRTGCQTEEVSRGRTAVSSLAPTSDLLTAHCSLLTPTPSPSTAVSTEVESVGLE